MIGVVKINKLSFFALQPFHYDIITFDPFVSEEHHFIVHAVLIQTHFNGAFLGSICLTLV